MNKFLLAASAAVAALTMAPAAQAAPFDVHLIQNGNSFTADFGNGGLNGSFSDTFTFLPSLAPSLGDIGIMQIGSNERAIEFTTLTFNGVNLLPLLSTQPGGQSLIYFEVPLDAGKHVLSVAGNVLGVEGMGNASYSGNVNFVTAPVPEPTTWAMMIFGIAAVGFTMRRSQTARVAFS